MKIQKFVFSSVTVLILTNIGNVLQYATQLVLGRMLTPTDYGIFNSVASFAVLFTSMMICVSFATAKETIFAVENDNFSQITTSLFFKFLIIGFSVCLFMIVISPVVRDYLNLKDILPIVIYSIIIVCLAIQAMLQGVLQGLQAYTSMSIAQLIMNIGRFAFTIFLLWMGFSYNGGLFAIILSYIAVFVFYYWFLSKKTNLSFRISQRYFISWKQFRRIIYKTLPILFLWTYLGVACNIDIPLVKHHFSDHSTGLYSAAAILGRIAFFLPSQLIFVLFPEIVRDLKTGDNAVGNVLVTCGLTILFSGIYCLAVGLFPSTIIGFLFGKEYMPASSLLVVISCSMAVLAMLNIVLNYLAAREKTYYFFLPMPFSSQQF